MKTTPRLRAALALFVFSTVLSKAQAQMPFRALYDAPVNAQEEQQLNAIFAQARAASANVQPGNMIDAAGTTKYAYTAGGQLWTEDGPFSSDTVRTTRTTPRAICCL